MLEDATLRMEPGPSAIPGGWASFVRDFTLRDERGARIDVEPTGVGQWRAERAIGRPVVLTYSLGITHDDTLPNGEPRYARDRTVTEIAFVRPWGVFMTGRVLFVLGAWMRDIDLVDHGEGTGDRDELGRRPGFDRGRRARPARCARRHDRRRPVGTRYSFAPARSLYTVRSAVRSYRPGGHGIDSIAVTAMLRFARVFGSVPPQVRGAPFTTTLLAIGDERNVMFVGGGLAGKDIAMLVPPDGPFSGDVTDGAIAHELFHLWNGGAFR